MAADELIITGFTFEELKDGVMDPASARVKMETGEGSTIEKCLVSDSMSLWSAVAALVVRVPTEKNLAVQLFWLRQMLDLQLITTFKWCDTRDMSADAHTKGSIPPDAILAFISGHFKYVHPTKEFVSPKPKAIAQRPTYLVVESTPTPPRPMQRKKYDPTAHGHSFSPYAHPAKMPEAESPRWRGILHGMYVKHNPERLKRKGWFETIMVKYKGREQNLYNELTTKYEGSIKGVVDNKKLAPMQCR